MERIDISLIKEILKEREPESYKGDFGHTLVIGGSYGFVGAGYFSAMGAVKSGSGLVTLGCRKELLDIYSIKLNEVMLLKLENEKSLEGKLKKFTSIVFGMGMGIDEFSENMLLYILENYIGTLVIDADGLTILKNHLDKIKTSKCNIILTPHYGEFSRLVNLPILEIKKDRLNLGINFAKKYNCTLLLKDHRTLITNSKSTYINFTGNSSMAMGGMGDVLAGMIGAFVSQKYSPLEATILSAYIHGLTGEILGEKKYCVTPSEIIENIPITIRNLLNKKL